MNTTVGFIIILILLLSALLAMVLVVMTLSEQQSDEDIKLLESKRNFLPSVDTVDDARIRFPPLLKTKVLQPNETVIINTTLSFTTIPFASTESIIETTESVIEATQISTILPTNTMQFKATTRRKSTRILPVTIRLNHSMFHGIEMIEEEIVDKPIHAIPTKYLKMIAEIKPLDGEKTIGLTKRNSTIYLIKNSGVLESLDETSFETSPVLQATFSFKKVEFFSNGKMAATEHNSSMLSIMDETGKIQRQLQLSYTPKDLHVFKDKIFVLSGSNHEIYVYDSELRLERSIKFMNNQKETCNFILPLDISIFVSCQSAILEISENGTLKKKFSTYGGSYSLAIAFVERSKLLFAVQRGQSQIHVFDYNAKLKTKLLQAHNSAALWSSLIIAQDRIYTLDYITNIIRIFDLPPINWSEIWNE